MKNLLVTLWVAFAVVACGGGGSSSGSTPPPASKPRLVGEIFGSAAEIASAEIQSTAGYAGNLTTSYAIRGAGKHNLLDLMLLFPEAGPQGRVLDRLRADAEQQLAQYASANAALLVPGVRVLVLDEIFTGSTAPADTAEALEPQLTALKAAIAMVRRVLPGVSVGVTVTPYATFGRPRTLDYIKQVLPLVDWVGTDPYWFGDASTIAGLHEWSRNFHGVAKAANPQVETWFIAQAFKLSTSDQALYDAFIAQELVYAEQYDHLIFFGWQFASELDPASAGKFFPNTTKRLYQKYLKTAL